MFLGIREDCERPKCWDGTERLSAGFAPPRPHIHITVFDFVELLAFISATTPPICALVQIAINKLKN